MCAVVHVDNTLLQYHLPFQVNDKRISKDGLSTLVQNGYIIRYSKRRQTPVFTAQKLNGKLLKQLKAKVHYTYADISAACKLL